MIKSSFIQNTLQKENLVSLSETSLSTSLRRNSDNRDWQLEAQGLDQLSRLLVKLQLALSVGQVQSGNFWDVLVLSLTLLLLQFEGNTSNWTLLDSLHQVGGVTSNLVSQTLGWNLSDLRGQTLVGLEVQSQLWVVTLNQSFGSSLNGFCSNTTLELIVSILPLRRSVQFDIMIGCT
jgi:hypothetical protein